MSARRPGELSKVALAQARAISGQKDGLHFRVHNRRKGAVATIDGLPAQLRFVATYDDTGREAHFAAAPAGDADELRESLAQLGAITLTYNGEEMVAEYAPTSHTYDVVRRLASGGNLDLIRRSAEQLVKNLPAPTAEMVSGAAGEPFRGVPARDLLGEQKRQREQELVAFDANWSSHQQRVRARCASARWRHHTWRWSKRALVMALVAAAGMVGLHWIRGPRLPAESYEWHPALATTRGRLAPFATRAQIEPERRFEQEMHPEAEPDPRVYFDLEDRTRFLSRQQLPLATALVGFASYDENRVAYAYLALLPDGVAPVLDKPGRQDANILTVELRGTAHVIFRNRPVQGLDLGPRCRLHIIYAFDNSLAPAVRFLSLSGSNRNLYGELVLTLPFEGEEAPRFDGDALATYRRRVQAERGWRLAEEAPGPLVVSADWEFASAVATLRAVEKRVGLDLCGR